MFSDTERLGESKCSRRIINTHKSHHICLMRDNKNELWKTPARVQQCH